MTYGSLPILPLDLSEIVDTLDGEAHCALELHRDFRRTHDTSNELAILDSVQTKPADLFAQDTQLLLAELGRLLHTRTVNTFDPRRCQSCTSRSRLG